MVQKILLFLISFPLLIFGEEYIEKEVVFIPFGEADSLLGFIPPIAEIGQNGDTVHFELGEAASSYDVQGEKFYVVDGVKANILIYNLKGKYIKSIGEWREETDEIDVRATSGQIKKVKVSNIECLPEIPGIIYGDANKKKYFEKIGDIAIDGGGNIYVFSKFHVEKDHPSKKGETYTISSRGLMKFSPEGKLLEIIDQFGEYGPEEIRDTDILFSDAYGYVYVNFGIKPNGRLTAEFDESGDLPSVGKYGSLDSKGRRYYLEYAYYKMPIKKLNKEATILVINGEKKEEKLINIKFHYTSNDRGFRGVDGDGNLYFSGGWALHKYDQKGNLLAIINVPKIVYEKEGVSVVPMGNVGKKMADGSSYIAYHFADGLRLIKQYIKPETKGQILKSAVKPKK